MSSTTLVVGGAGYVGCHTVLQLLQHGWNVTVIDNVEICKCRKPESLLQVEDLVGKETNYYNCSIQDQDALNDVFKCEKIHCVIHLASIKNYSTHPLQFYQNDVSGTLCLLEVMKQHHVTKIIFSSTIFVYGSPDNDSPITEDEKTGNKLLNAFSKSKYMIEEILKDLCKSDSDWCAVILRHGIPAGAHESGSLGEKWMKNHVTSIAKHAMITHEKIYISREEYESFHEEGLCDYVHVSDVAAAYVLATNKMLSNFNGFKAYNLGSGHPHTIVDVMERISVLSGEILIYEVVEDGTTESSFYVSGKLAEIELGWRPKKDLNDICRDTLKWIRVNKTILTARDNK